MFYFFKEKENLGAWGNPPGDEFFQLTCIGMGWIPSEISLVYFPNTPQTPKQYANVIVTQNELKYLDEDNNVIFTMGAIKYVENGNMLIQC
jgi:hypothetical protein